MSITRDPDALSQAIQKMLETGEYHYLSPYCDIETGRLDGTFTALQLRTIAAAMEVLESKR